MGIVHKTVYEIDPLVVCKHIYQCELWGAHKWGEICKAPLTGKTQHQISANNLTPLATRKKLGIRLLLGYEYQAESGVKTRLE